MEKEEIVIDKKQFVHKGEEKYQALKEKLEPEHKGKIVAIDIETGDYFLGESVIEAVKKGREKYPNKIFFTAKVGFPVVHSHK